MNKEIVLFEMFSGIGGFAKGLQDAGFVIKKHYFSEIDKHAIANYKYNFPNAEYVGSVQDAIRYQYSEKPNIVTFGWPCQDNSIAGKRKGQRRGTRSGLLFDAGNVILKLKPECFLAENVKGLYSVNEGFDFYQAIEFLTYLNTDRPQYTVEMQLLNTKWFLPQNRERTYFVGHIGTQCTQRVFPIGENYEEIDKFVEGTQAYIVDTNYLHRDCAISKNSPTLSARDYKDPKIVLEINKSQDGKVFSVDGISASLSAGHGNMPKIQVKSATKSGYEIASNGDSVNLSMPNSTTRRGRVGRGIAQTLDTQSNQAVIVKALTETRTEEAKEIRRQSQKQGRDFSPRRGKEIKTRDDDNANTIIATSTIENCVIQINQSVESGGKQPYQQNRVYDINGLSPTIDQAAGRWSLSTSDIRRLTEVECERLQGFPDNWTMHGSYSKSVWLNKKEKTFKIVEGVFKIPKSQRYKLCGNAVSTVILKEIGKRLLNIEFENIITEEEYSMQLTEELPNLMKKTTTLQKQQQLL